MTIIIIIMVSSSSTFGWIIGFNNNAVKREGATFYLKMGENGREGVRWMITMYIADSKTYIDLLVNE